MRTLLVCLGLVLAVLHQDVWNWRRATPAWFGFLPPGLWYHALYCLAASGYLWLLCRFLWPSQLEEEVERHRREHPGVNRR